jgi:hypothetical protein
MDHSSAIITEVVEVEFPSVRLDRGDWLTLDLKTKVLTPTYKKVFVQDSISYDLQTGQVSNDCCYAEMWIIKNNPKYDYLHKEEKLTL